MNIVTTRLRVETKTGHAEINKPTSPDIFDNNCVCMRINTHKFISTK